MKTAPGWLALAGLLCGAPLAAQEEPAVPRPPEGSRIINLSSADVPPAGTLGLIFTHRFAQPLEDSDWHSLGSFDSGADIGIGISYVFLEGLELSLDRSSSQDDFEMAARWQLVRRSASNPFAFAVRAGANARTAVQADRETGYFAQAIAAFSLGSLARITIVPTYVSKSAGTPFVSLPHEDVFNVPVAVSVRISKSVNAQGELIPRRGRYGSPGTGWIAAIEKTVLRHRFAFTVGNVRTTTVDQYTAPDFDGLPPEDYFIGFNLVRQWKLK